MSEVDRWNDGNMNEEGKLKTNAVEQRLMMREKESEKGGWMKLVSKPFFSGAMKVFDVWNYTLENWWLEFGT